MYLLDDQGVRRLEQGAQWVGYWGLWHCRWWRGGWWRDDRHGHHMQDIVLDLLCC